MTSARRTSTAGLVIAALAGCGGGGTTDNTCADTIGPGDLVITEVFADADAPSGSSGADEGREWFEIYNATNRTIDLTGLEIFHSRDDDTMLHDVRLDPVSIAAGDYLVLGDVLPDLKPAHVDYGYGATLGDLYNTGIGKLALRCGTTEIDVASYTDVAPGRTRQLDGGVTPDYTVNDDLASWCESTDAASEFIPANRGTPGAANEDCAHIVPGMCDDNGTLRATVPPAAGDLVITEVMPSPDLVGDELGEWFEVRADRAVDLNDVALERVGDSAEPDVVAAEACVSVAAGALVVFARSSDPLVNGGLPAVAATFTFSLVGGSLTSPGDVALYADATLTTLIDQVAWTASPTGASLQVDPDFANPTDNDVEANFCAGTTPYGAGDLGTPGADNLECVFVPPPGFCDDGGALRPIINPVAGDLVITEVMPSPAAVSDTVGEWFEVLALADFDLNDLGLDRAGDASGPDVITSVPCLPVTTGTRVVFARNSDPLVNGGLPPVPATFSFSMTVPGDVRVLHPDATVLDAVTWTAATSGASRQLDPDFTDPAGNDVEANFCDGVPPPFGAGDLGTPGDPNNECPLIIPPGSCYDTTALVVRPIDKPVIGDVVISEWLPDPTQVADTAGEWMEILAVTPIDLNGLQLGDTVLATAPVIVSTDCVSLPAGGRALFAKGNNPATNGGLTGVDGVFPTGVSLTNTAGTVQVGVDDAAVDTRTWASTSPGVAIQLDTDLTQCNAPAGTLLYNGTDRGTPEAAHDLECP